MNTQMSYAIEISWQDFSYPVFDMEIEIFKYLESVLFCFHVSIYSMQIPIQLSIGSAFPANRCLPGGHLNKKDGLTRYGHSHVKDKTS